MHPLKLKDIPPMTYLAHPIREACLKGDINELNAWIHQFPELLNESCYEGVWWPPLFVAASAGQLAVIDILLQSPDILVHRKMCSKFASGEIFVSHTSVLSIAAANNHLSLVQHLLTTHHIVDQLCKYDLVYALDSALYSGHFKVATYLFETTKVRPSDKTYALDFVDVQKWLEKNLPLSTS